MIIVVGWAIQRFTEGIFFDLTVMLSDKDRFYLNGNLNEQNCRIWSEKSHYVYVKHRCTIIDL